MSDTNIPDSSQDSGSAGRPGPLGDDPAHTVALQIEQLGDTLDDLARNVRRRHPLCANPTMPPSWSEVRQLNRVLLLLCEAGIELGIRHGRVRRGGAVEPGGEDEAPACGHSACRQNWIDSGEQDCVAGDEA